MLTVTTTSKNGLIIHMPLLKIDSETEEKAREKFQSSYAKGILSPQFDADVWKVNNEQYKVSINFGHRREELSACCAKHDIDPMLLINYLKTYIVLRLGTCNATELQAFVRYTITEFLKSDAFTSQTDPSPRDNGKQLYHFIDFIDFLPFTTQEYKEVCESCLSAIYQKNADYKRNGKQPCTLNEFLSYFRLDYILSEFWSKCNNTDQKAFYYPFYIFWCITTILPMRVTEFCVTPYDCLRREESLCFLTIRRSRLKGSSSKSPRIHYYTIEGDYDTFEYEVPESLYNLIEEYRTLTKGYCHPYGLLFSLEHLLSLQHAYLGTVDTTKVFRSEQLGYIIKTFYNEIVCQEFGYSIVDENDLKTRYLSEKDGTYEMAENEIMLVQAKHTRHLAMINLIMRGCNPVMIKEFAGHADEATSANYYGNISKTIRCATKVLYDKANNRRSNEHGRIQDKHSANPLSVLINEALPHVEVDYGSCYSERFLNNNYTDCGAVNGECMKCRYFMPNHIEKTLYLEANVDSELDFVMKLLRDPKIEDRIQDYQVEMQQLQSKISNLSLYYWREFEKEYANGETT